MAFKQNVNTTTTNNGQFFTFHTTPTLPLLLQEHFQKDAYQVLKLQYNPNDIILDIGANEGIWSILMAKRFPWVRIHAYEPIKWTYEVMLRNLELNKVDNVAPHNIAVDGAFQSRKFIAHRKISGGASAIQTEFDPVQHYTEMCDTTTLDAIIRNSPIRLLKIDVEGMEYDILYPCKSLSKVRHIVGELHINEVLKKAGRNMDDLEKWLSKQVQQVGHFDRVKMSE